MRASLLALLLGGCVGHLHSTTTPRTAREMLLVSTAHQRALARLDATPLAGRRVFVDLRFLRCYDEDYVASAFFQMLAEDGALLVREREEADVIVEVRAAAGGGIWHGDWIIGIPIPYPEYYVPEEHLESVPFLLEIGYSLREGWARLVAFAYERESGRFVAGLDGWGRSHIGFTENVYPPATILETLQEKVE